MRRQARTPNQLRLSPHHNTDAMPPQPSFSMLEPSPRKHTSFSPLSNYVIMGRMGSCDGRDCNSRFQGWSLLEGISGGVASRVWAKDGFGVLGRSQEARIINLDIQKLQKTPQTHHMPVLNNSTPGPNSTQNQNNLFQLQTCRKPKHKLRQTGLSKLSHRAYEIVRDGVSVTYKNVADRLVKEIAEQGTAQCFGEFQQEDDEDAKNDSLEKKESNVKRRVYDALNVLIALGILKKEAKLISYCHEPKFNNLLLSQKQQQIFDKRIKLQQKYNYKGQLQSKLHQLKLLKFQLKTSPPSNPTTSTSHTWMPDLPYVPISTNLFVLQLPAKATPMIENQGDTTTVRIETGKSKYCITDVTAEWRKFHEAH